MVEVPCPRIIVSHQTIRHGAEKFGYCSPMNAADPTEKPTCFGGGCWVA